MIRPTVAGFLAGKRIPHAVIGAVALAVHGAPRYSADVDVLVLDPAVLDLSFWAGHSAQPRSIRRGDGDDPPRHPVGARRLRRIEPGWGLARTLDRRGPGHRDPRARVSRIGAVDTGNRS